MKKEGTDTTAKLRQRIAALETLTTEQKETLRELEQERAALRAVVEHVPSYIYAKDEGGRYTLSNPTHARFLGQKDPKEVVGQTPFDLFPPELASQYHADDEKVMRTGQAIYDREEVSVNQHGEKVWNLTTKVPLHDKEGEIVGLVGISHDVTERKRAREALRESEEKYRNLAERANDGICIIQDFTVKYANPRLAEMWGGPGEEIIGTRFDEYVHPDEIPELLDRYKRRMAGEEVPQIYETVLKRKDGGKVYTELNAGLITYQGKSADLLFIRDITERKRVEEELRHHREHLEELVEERTERLRTLVDAMTGREVRMAGLKEVIKKLRAQLEEAGLEPVANDPLLGGGG